MKKILALLLLTLFAAIPEVVMASSYNLTFTGTVSGGSIGSLAQAANVNIGSTVTYTFKINTDEKGYTLNNNGKKNYKNNSYYITSTSGLLNGKTDGLSYYITDNKKNDPKWSSFKGYIDNGVSNIYIDVWNRDLTDILNGKITTITDGFYGDGALYEESKNPNDHSNTNYSQLVVTNLTVKASPTPIPGTILVMLSGLGIVVLLKRKFAPNIAA